MNRWETTCRYNLAETCVESITVDALLGLAGMDRDAFLAALLPMRLTYGAIEGTDRLRSAIAALYETATPDDVLVTHGAIGANHLAYQALVEPGDVVVSIVPTYQQHTSIPESLGAEVRLLRLREERGWLPDLDELRSLAAGAKVIALVNPNNPTGSLLGETALREIVSIARQRRRMDRRRRGLPRYRPGGPRHQPVARRSLRANGRHRQHVEGVLARRAAARLGHRPPRGSRRGQQAPRLLGHQRRHGRRPARRDRVGGPRRAPRAEPGDCAREPRDPRRVGGGGGADLLRRSRGQAPPPCSATRRISRPSHYACDCSRRKASCSRPAARSTPRATCGSATRTTRRSCARASRAPPRSSRRSAADRRARRGRSGAAADPCRVAHPSHGDVLRTRACSRR